MSRGGLWAVGLLGCAQTDYTPVDWLLEIDAALSPDAATVEICVEDGVVKRVGPADGRYAVVGLPRTREPVVQVTAFDLTGAPLGSTGWVQSDEVAPFDVVPTDCVPGPPAPPDRAGVLGVRFVR